LGEPIESIYISEPIKICNEIVKHAIFTCKDKETREKIIEKAKELEKSE